MNTNNLVFWFFNLGILHFQVLRGVVIDPQKSKYVQKRLK
jgi:hypothetical protein